MKKLGWIIPLFLLVTQTGWAQQQQCDPEVANSCQQLGLPTCFFCDNGGCVSDDNFCDDGNDCTVDDCIDNAEEAVQEINGCTNISLVLLGETDELPAECFVCDPTANDVPIENGICDLNAGENCSNSADCQAPGEVCQTPPPPETCDTQLNVCADGDVCTEDICVLGEEGPDQCDNPDLACRPFPDGCCPKGCVGPGVGEDCPLPTIVAVVPETCDPDCWPAQDCGDGLVEAPETCDDNADTGVAGVRPNGSDVSNADCRDPGTTNECTYCGDGIRDIGSEECDGADDDACEFGCATDCTCNPEPVFNPCLQGSGNVFGDNGNDNCKDFACSLNQDSTMSFGQGMGGIAMLIMASLAMLGVRRRLN